MNKRRILVCCGIKVKTRFIAECREPVKCFESSAVVIPCCKLLFAKHFTFQITVDEHDNKNLRTRANTSERTRRSLKCALLAESSDRINGFSLLSSTQSRRCSQHSSAEDNSTKMLNRSTNLSEAHSVLMNSISLFLFLRSFYFLRDKNRIVFEYHSEFLPIYEVWTSGNTHICSLEESQEAPSVFHTPSHNEKKAESKKKRKETDKVFV